MSTIGVTGDNSIVRDSTGQIIGYKANVGPNAGKIQYYPGYGPNSITNAQKIANWEGSTGYSYSGGIVRDQSGNVVAFESLPTSIQELLKGTSSHTVPITIRLHNKSTVGTIESKSPSSLSKHQLSVLMIKKNFFRTGRLGLETSSSPVRRSRMSVSRDKSILSKMI